MPTVSLLATVGDLAASQTAGGISALLPSGTILPFGGASAPTGWLLCNGATISRTTYANLFAAISTAHGSGDGSTTFHLPDLRGRFMRGVDGAVARDPDRAARTAANSGGNTGDNVGSVQTNATSKNGLSNVAPTFTGSSVSSGPISNNHTHIQTTVSGTSGAGNPYVWPNIGPWYWSSYGNSGAPTYDNQQGHTHNLTASGSVSAPGMSAGDNETRPLNANVNYIIKV